MTKKKEARGSNLGKRIKGMDMFGSRPSFEIDGRSTLNTYTGSLLSFCIICVSLTFLSSRMQILLNYQDTSYQSAKLEGENRNQTISQEDSGFNIAFNIIDLYDYGPLKSVDYAGYLEIRAFMLAVNLTGPIFTELKTHTCTQQDKSEKFNEISESLNYVSNFFDDGKLLCLDDPSQINLVGDST